MGNRRVRLVVVGEVQGVSFRWSAREQAQRLRVLGWVRNLDTGEVEAVAEGEDAAVAGFIAWCRVGPPAARVDDVRVEEGQPTGEFQDFGIRR